jgi:uridine kinase
MSAGRPPPFLLGVGGGSGSGKTTVAEHLCGVLGGPDIALVRMDAYYRDRPDLSAAQRREIDYDHPDAFDWRLLVDHVHALRDGSAVDVPTYDFTRDRRRTATTNRHCTTSPGSYAQLIAAA